MTRDECPSILGTVALSGRPFVASGSTARLKEWMRVGLVESEVRKCYLEPRESQLKARKAALAAMKLPHE